MNVFLFIQWNKYIHEVKDGMFYSTRQSHCFHKHSLFVYHMRLPSTPPALLRVCMSWYIVKIGANPHPQPPPSWESFFVYGTKRKRQQQYAITVSFKMSTYYQLNGGLGTPCSQATYHYFEILLSRKLLSSCESYCLFVCFFPHTRPNL